MRAPTGLPASPSHTNKPNLLNVQVRRYNTASQRFLFSNFRYYFTLFSKFFSSFPHGTCSLSVSHPYLALDGIYHPLELQSQTTRLVEDRSYASSAGTNGAITLLGGPFQITLPTDSTDLASPDYNSEDFQSEPFPLHSPLLRESWLVSFPPPNNMLKFSGYS